MTPVNANVAWYTYFICSCDKKKKKHKHKQHEKIEHVRAKAYEDMNKQTHNRMMSTEVITFNQALRE